MQTVTLHIEDTLNNKLRDKAKSIGVSVDNYIVYVLNRQESADDNNENIEKLLSSMQLKGHEVPSTETGKGALVDTNTW